MLQDLRFAFRLMVKDRWYAVLAIVAIALGIGVNATGFTVINGVFLRGPAFQEADRLYMLSWLRMGRENDMSYAELRELRSQSNAFSGIAAFREDTVNISDDRAMPEQVEGAQLTANAFGVLRQPPLIGRDFVAGEDLRGAERAVIIGYRLWQNRYRADPNVLGTLLRIDGEPSTIVGVMPDKMNFPINAELWTPLVSPAEPSDGPWGRSLGVFGRLRNGATRRQAETELNGFARRLETASPETNKNLVGRVETITEKFVGGAARVVFPIVMGAAGFVLLIACANVANLLLSRSAQRAREIGVRIALGASRWRVLRQLLLESVVLSCIGGVGGVLLAFAGARAVDAAITDPGKPYWIVFNLDYVVFAYTAAICVLTGIIFGFAPALHVSNTNINDVMRQTGRGMAGGRTRWFSGAMVIVELTLTIVLLVGAGLMIRSFFNLYNLDLGIRTEELMAMRLQLSPVKYTTPASRRAFFEQLEQHLSAVPGVEAIAVSTSVPPLGGGYRPFEIDGRPPRAAGGQAVGAATVTISPRFFDVIGVQIRRGRNFNATDGDPGSGAVIINERFASIFFSGEDPLGQRLRFTGQDQNPAWRTIVGVSPSIRHGSTRNAEMPPAIYVPYYQEPPASASLLVRSGLPPTSVMDGVRREVLRVDQDQPVFTIETLDQILAQNRFGVRLTGGLFGVFAAIALGLSAVGLYGVMSYAVVQRTQEIGVRMALGAGSGQVCWLILKRGFVQLSVGIVLGLAGGFALSQLLQTVLVGVTPADPLTFIGVTIVQASVAFAACMIPARRATRIDPLSAIRSE